LAAAAGVIWKFTHKGDFLYAGTIEATEVDVSSRASGVIEQYKATEGCDIAKNATLVSLECNDVRLAADIAQKDYARAKELLTAGSMSQENYDRLKYRRDDAALRQDWCTIKSPVGGTVLYKYHENGELINAGTKLATVADLSEVYAYVYVPHDIISKLSVGMEVDGILPEMNNRVFPGRITVINEEAEFTPKNVQTQSERTRLVFGVKVTFKNPDRLLKPGMTIEAKLPS
jgi:HlyD family secretion protein